ncbi:hypothetical protein ACSFA7_14090 [Variovorax sp. LT1R20]|uniref:hypothetical protein n=1 Tax=Variovorax sp. LT1R20 TaxID=3443729 RepID=UPI003F48260C
MNRGSRVEIHGDAGQVAAGDFHLHNHYWTSGFPTEGVPVTPWWELPTEELRGYLREERTEFWRAWRRYWFNVPCLLMAAMLLGTTAKLAATVAVVAVAGPSGLLGAVEWWLPAGLICIGTPIAFWMYRIRRVEGIAAAQAQQNIDGLEAVLTRRKRLRR